MDSRGQFLELGKRKRTINSLVRLNKLACEVFAIFMHIQRGGGRGGKPCKLARLTELARNDFYAYSYEEGGGHTCQ